MANSVGIRLNNIEEERVLGAMLAAGDENVSTHIKRLYFKALDLEQQNTTISDTLDDIQHQLSYLQHAQLEQADNPQSTDNALMLQLLSNLYLMVRNSVSAPIRLQADGHINIQAIEEYLSDTDAIGTDVPDDPVKNAAVTPQNTASESNGESGGGGRAGPLSPYLQGKLQAQHEIAHRVAERKSERQKILWPDDEARTAKQAKLATLVSQPSTFMQKVKKNFTR